MRSTRPALRRGFALLVAVAAGLGAGPASPAWAAESTRPAHASTELSARFNQPADSNSGGSEQVNGPTALPRPNSGSTPQSAYDRGGAAQYAVFVGMLASFALIAWLFRRDMRRARAARSSAGGPVVGDQPTP